MYKDSNLYKHFAATTGYKDEVFKFALSLLPKKNAYNFIEVGATRNWSKHCRVTDGWSTFFWLDYLTENTADFRKSTLTICDIDPETLELAQRILVKNLSSVQIKVSKDTLLMLSDADFDLVYLDGSDSPTQMKDQYEWAVESEDVVIVIDDRTIKGSLLPTNVPYRDFDLEVDFDGYQTTHYMRVYHKSLSTQPDLGI